MAQVVCGIAPNDSEPHEVCLGQLNLYSIGRILRENAKLLQLHLLHAMRSRARVLRSHDLLTPWPREKHNGYHSA